MRICRKGWYGGDVGRRDKQMKNKCYALLSGRLVYQDVLTTAHIQLESHSVYSFIGIFPYKI